MNQKMKKFLSFILSATVLTTTFMNTKVLKTLAVESAETTKITIMGTSDVHGRFMPWDYAMDASNTSGSMTQLFSLVQSVRNENPGNTILVDAGDSTQDNSVELFNNQPSHPMVTAMNFMGYDIWNMGNHEFNFGLDVLKNLTGQFNGTTLGGNIYKEDGSHFMPAYKIIEKSGIKIGIIGMDTPMVSTFEKGTDHINGLTFKDPVEETKKAIAELKGQVDVIVGVMHMGEDNENGISNTGVRDIANACPELAAIIAGHMHLLVKQDNVNGVLITEPGKYGAALSRIDLSFKKENGKVELISKTSSTMPVTSTTPSNNELAQVLTPFHEAARQDANTVIGQLYGMDMVPANEIDGIPTVQIQSTTLTEFLNEVQMYYAQSSYGKVDAVAISIDNDKAKLPIGPIKKKDIAYNYQYAGGETSVYEMTGKDLKTYMEWAAGYFNSTKAGDVTVSFDPKRRASKYSTNDIFGGVSYIIDLTKPAGSRIANLVDSQGKKIDDSTPLKVATNEYRLGQLVGKGGPFEGKSFKKVWSSKEAFGEDKGTIRSMAMEYIKTVKGQKVTPVLLNNWKIVGVDTTSPERKAVIELVKASILSVPKTSDGKYTNIASINIKELVSQKEIDELCEKAKVSKDAFSTAMTKGEFYSKLNAAINGVSDTTSVGTNAEDTKTSSVELPKTGSLMDTNILIAFGFSLMLAGLYIAKRAARKI